MADTSDPERVEEVAGLLREEFPEGTVVTYNDPGELGPVGYTIAWRDGRTSSFAVSWEVFQEDQTDMANFIRDAIGRVSPGTSWLLGADGTLEWISRTA